MVKDIIKYIAPIILILALVTVSGCTETTLNEGNLTEINDTIDSYMDDVDAKSNSNKSVGANTTFNYGMNSGNFSNDIEVNVISSTKVNATLTRVVSIAQIKSEPVKTGSTTNYQVTPWVEYEETWEFTLEYQNDEWVVTSAKKTASEKV